MYKSTTEKTQAVKGTGLVKALGTGLLDSWSPTAVKVAAFLAYCGGDAHASNHHDWYVLVGLPRRTYYRVLGQLEAQEVIEICTDERCPHAIWGALGWRFTLRFTRWLDRPDRPYASATRGTESVPSVAHLELVESRGTQGVSSTRRDTEENKRTADAAAPSGRGAKEEPEMTTRGPEDWVDRTFGEDPDSPSPPRHPKGKSPTTRLRYAFEDECRRLKEYWGVPVTPSVKQMMGGIKWLLDQGYPENEIRESFRYLPNVLGRQSVGTHRTMWEVYFQYKAELLQQAIHGAIGSRGEVGGESAMEQALAAAERRKRAT